MGSTCRRWRSEETTVATNEPAAPRRRALVATNGEIREDRAVDVLDTYGGMVTLEDADIATVIALLARHLAGETVTFVEQETIADWRDSDTLDEALAHTTAQLAALETRKQAIEDRQRAIAASVEDDDAHTHTVHAEAISFGDLLHELARSRLYSGENTPTAAPSDR